MTIANFPSSPANGDTTQIAGITYQYDGTKQVWDRGSTGNAPLNAVAEHILPVTNETYDLGSANKKFRDLYLSGNTLNIGAQAISADAGGIVLPAVTIGTGTNKVVLAANADGGLTQTGTNSAGVTAPAKEAGAATEVADMAALIAMTGMASGQTVLVTGLNRIFMYASGAWRKIADMTNDSPTAITGVASAFALAIDGTATVITAVSTDPEGFPLTWSYAVTTGTLGSTATVSQADNVFTITPSSTEADAGSFSITFSVTDGATGAVSATSAFTLVFIVEIEIDAWTDYVINQSNSIAASTTGYISATMKNSSQTGPGNLPLSNVPLKQGRYYFEIKILGVGNVFPSLFTGYHTPFWNFGFVSHSAAVAGTLGSNLGNLSGSAALAKWQNGSKFYGSNQNGAYTQAPYPDLLMGAGGGFGAASFVGNTYSFAYDTSTKKAWIGYNGTWETGGTTHLGGDPTGTGVGSDLSNLASDDFGLVLGNDHGSYQTVWWGMLAQWMTASGGTPTYSPPSGFSHYNP
mgnify:CR=1 FL=1